MIHRSFLSLLLLSVMTCSLSAAEPKVVPVWPDTPPGPAAKVTGEEFDRQKPTDRLVGDKTVMKITNIANAELHIYPAPKEKANGAACIICPGGGYNILAWDLEGTEVAEWFNTIGVTGIVLKYRTPTGPLGDPEKWHGPVMDAQRALSLTRSHAKEWNIDPERVGVLGFSAGGNLAAHTAVENGHRLYKNIDAVDDASCAPDFAMLIYPAYISDKEGNLTEGFGKVTEKTPRMFFVHAANDPVTPLSSALLFAELEKANVSAELHIYPTGGHGYGLRATNEAVTHWPKRAGAWMKESGLLGE